jgi:hypothetical protein
MLDIDHTARRHIPEDVWNYPDICMEKESIKDRKAQV